MTISANILRRLSALDIPAEAFKEVLSIISDIQAADESRRQNAKDRTAKWRKAGDVTVTSRDDGDHNAGGDVTVTSRPEATSPERHGDATRDVTVCHKPRHDPLLSSSLSEEPLKEVKKVEEGVVEGRRFDGWPPDAALQFWKRYPLKVGKGAAMKVLAAVRRRVSFPELMAGLDRYIAAQDPEYYCHPAKWLRDERWADEVRNGSHHGPEPPEKSGPPLLSPEWRKLNGWPEKGFPGEQANGTVALPDQPPEAQGVFRNGAQPGEGDVSGSPQLFDDFDHTTRRP